MKKNNIFLAIAIIFIITVVWVLLSNSVNLFVQEEKIEIFQEQIKEQGQIKNKATLIVDGGKELFYEAEVEFEEGMTVFDLLNNELEKLNLVLKFETYDLGIFIEAIGDKENGEDGKYWLYYVNGETPMLASNKNKIETGDEIEFKFEESIF